MNREQCEKTFTDKMTGKRFDRPEFLKMLEQARAGTSLWSGDWTDWAAHSKN